MGPTTPPVNGRILPIGRLCASIAFDRGQCLIAACLGQDVPRLYVVEPRSMVILAQLDLPTGTSTGGALDFGGGGYFYLDHRDRVVIPTRTTCILFAPRGNEKPRNEKAPSATHDIYFLTPQNKTAYEYNSQAAYGRAFCYLSEQRT